MKSPLTGLSVSDVVIHGNRSVLDAELALVLNSRQTKTPIGSDEWIRSTLGAVRSSIDSGRTVISSVGMNTWEIVLWAVSKYGGRTLLILPETESIEMETYAESVFTDFHLDPSDHAWIFISGVKSKRSRKSWWHSRDEVAISLADAIIPVSVRDRGRLADFLKTDINEAPIDDSFRVEYRHHKRNPVKIAVPDKVQEFTDWHYVTHWTKRTNGPWPEETSFEYYEDVVNSTERYPRLACDTLRRILNDRRIRGSGNHMKSGKPMVSFTSLAPHKAVELMKWRKRYVLPTFEPYGIAIERQAAEIAGILPVTYVKNRRDDITRDTEFVQGYGTGEWFRECEYRHPGDIDLAEFDRRLIRILVPTVHEAGFFRDISDYETLPLEV